MNEPAMTTTFQSETGKLLSVVIKPAANAMYSEEQIRNEWQSLNFLDAPDRDRALAEYHAFEKILLDHHIRVRHLAPDESLTMDSMYCRDASILTDQGAILCRMGKSSRCGEPEAAGALFYEMDIPILGKIKSPGTVEGGDVAWLNNRTLAVGHTYRTNLDGIRQLKDMLDPLGVKVIVADLPHFRGPTDVFHLMSILSPVADDLAVVYAPLMPIAFRLTLLELGYQLIEVPEVEFNRIGCNVLALAPRVCLMVEGHPQTQVRLQAAGCTVLTYAGEEISIKGGGGPTCLTRPLKRSMV